MKLDRFFAQMTCIFPAVFGIAIGAGGILNNQPTQILIACGFICLSIIFSLIAAADALAQAKDNDEDTYLRMEPICCICSGGPGNPHSPGCVCGHEMWDIDPAQGLDPVRN